MLIIFVPDNSYANEDLYASSTKGIKVERYVANNITKDESDSNGLDVQLPDMGSGQIARGKLPITENGYYRISAHKDPNPKRYVGYTKGGNHTGTDINTYNSKNIRTHGNSIHPVKPGVIVRLRDTSGSYGTAVWIAHPDNTLTVYAHMIPGSNKHLKVGQITDTSTIIGKQGTSGNSSGYHLHLETRVAKSGKKPPECNPENANKLNNFYGAGVNYYLTHNYDYIPELDKKTGVKFKVVRE